MDSNPRFYLNGYGYNMVISMNSQSKWVRIGKILIILIVVYIVQVAYISAKGPMLNSYVNPFLIALTLTFGYIASWILNVVKRRFLPLGTIFIAWGLFMLWFERSVQDQYLGIALIIIGFVTIFIPLSLRDRVPAY